MKKIYHKIDNIIGPIITLKADHVGLFELARIHKKNGEKKLAHVVSITEHDVSLLVFGGSKGIRTDDRVEFLGHAVKVNFAKDHLLGRMFNGLFEPIDGRPPLPLIENIDVAGFGINPLKLNLPSRMIETGLPMIDMFNTMVEGQKLAIMSTPGERHRDVLMRIALQSDADVILVGAMGISHDDLSFFRQQLADRRKETIMFVHTALEIPTECILIPAMTLTVAENYALLGARVLVLLTDMTTFSDAVNEIAVIMGKISPSDYYGSFYDELALIHDGAGVIKDAGSITTVSVSTAPDEDENRAVAFVDGQLLVKNGGIDPLGSLSWVKQLVNKHTRDDHVPLMNFMLKHYHQARQMRKLKDLGFSISRYDEKLLAFAHDFEEQMMGLEINLPFFEQLNLSWKIIAKHFLKDEVDIEANLVERYWPPLDSRDKKEQASYA